MSLKGTLYLVATPLGNLEDITLRALGILKNVDLIACEDTRHTAKLCTRYSISTPKESYHKFNEEERTQRFLEMLREGKTIALVSDAGTPLVSDPGYTLVSECRKEKITVTPIPGPSAAIAALVGSGLPADAFLFIGFLPSRAAARRSRLQELAGVPATLVLFEAPHRLLASLDDMIAVLGDRRACLARELTKIHEEFLHGTLREILDSLRERSRIQGEITMVIDRGFSDAPPPVYPDSIKQHLEQEIRETGRSRNEALKSVARQRGLSRKEAYNLLIEE